jgi:hypothetical protein
MEGVCECKIWPDSRSARQLLNRPLLLAMRQVYKAYQVQQSRALAGDRQAHQAVSAPQWIRRAAGSWTYAGAEGHGVAWSARTGSRWMQVRQVPSTCFKLSTLRCEEKHAKQAMLTCVCFMPQVCLAT